MTGIRTLGKAVVGLAPLVVALGLVGGWMSRSAWSDDAPTGAVAGKSQGEAAEHAGGADTHAKSDGQATPDAHETSPDGHGATGSHVAAADHGGGHDDPYDLSHGNASAKLERPDDLKFDLAIYTALVFFLLLLGLTKFAWGPICHLLEAREHSIAAMIEEARTSAEKATQQLKAYEAKLAAAADEARELMVQARREGEVLREQIVGEAKAAAQRERDRAVADIGAARDVALRDIAQRSVDTAITLAGQIVRRELRPQDHQVLVREVLEQLPAPN